MEEQYKYAYSDQSPYGNAWHLIAQLNQPGGVHLDLGCSYGAISKMVSPIYTYVGIDENEAAVSFLKGKGLEAYRHSFGDKEKDTAFIKSVLCERPLSQVTLLDVLEHLPDPKTILSPLHDILLEHNAPLIVSIPNIAHRDIALKLMGGDFCYTETGLLDKTHVSFFTESRISEVFKDCGFVQIGSCDYHLGISDQHFPEDNTLISEGTLVSRYLKWIKSVADPSATVNQFIRAYLPVKLGSALKKEPLDRPFLSVVMRTQGKRPEALQEALLCLSAQNNKDFELLIIPHKVKKETLDWLRKTIEATPIWLQRCTRIITVDYGNRTAPLSEGFKNARGKYISVFDDDDILFENWVDTFYKLSLDNNGRVLHAYAVTQDWEMVSNNDCSTYLRATGKMESIYCRDFDYLAQLTTNFCPVMSLAFPAYSYHHLGIQFDETLTITEDWDFLMRTVAVCGIADSSQVTSIYRLWTNAENSLTVHDPFERQRNYEQILLKRKQNFLLLPPENVSQLIDMLTQYQAAISNPAPLTALPVFSLYFDSGKGFSEKAKKSAPANLSISEVDLFFTDLDDLELVQTIRFDPTELQGVMLRDFETVVRFKDGSTEMFTLDDITCNGIKGDDGLTFVFPDPQIVIRLKSGMSLDAVEIKAKISYEIPEDIYREITASLQSSRLICIGNDYTLVSDDSINQPFSLYFDTGEGFSEEVRKCLQAGLSDDITLKYDKLEQLGQVKALRFDPTELKGIILHSLEITAQYLDNSIAEFGPQDISTNGLIHDDTIIFPESDPQIFIPLEFDKELNSVSVKLSIASLK